MPTIQRKVSFASSTTSTESETQSTESPKQNTTMSLITGKIPSPLQEQVKNDSIVIPALDTTEIDEPEEVPQVPLKAAVCFAEKQCFSQAHEPADGSLKAFWVAIVAVVLISMVPKLDWGTAFVQQFVLTSA